MARALGQIDLRKTAAILDAAETMIGRNGPGVSLTQIALSAGVSKQTFYSRFGSRRALLGALASDRAARRPPPHIAKASEDAACEALDTYVLQMMAYLKRPLHRQLLAPSVPDAMAAGAEWQHSVLGRAHGDLAAFLREQSNISGLVVHDPTATAALLLQFLVAETLAPIRYTTDPNATLPTINAFVARILAALNLGHRKAQCGTELSRED